MEPLSSRWNSILTATILFSLIGPAQRAAASQVQTLDIRPPVSLVGAERLYWIGTGSAAEDAMRLREALIAAGARNVNLFVPDMVIVCDAPRGAIDQVKQVASSTTFRMRSGRDLRMSTAEDASWGWILESYALAERVARGEGAAALAPNADGDDGFRDLVTTLSAQQADDIQRRINAQRRMETAPRPQITRTVFQNSEILSGGILANFVYPESSGQTEPDRESWSDDDLRQARAGATAAFLSWQGKFPNMDITYILHHFERVPCAYEPITHEISNDNLWIANVMHELGWGLHTKDPFEIVHEFNETERVNWHMQWAVTSFIATSRNTPTHRFDSGTAGYIAYANLGGPYMVEPFPAGRDLNQIGETLLFSQIAQHEISHQFWTLDEYRGAGECTMRSGYMDVPNGNVTMVDPDGLDFQCYPPLVPCLMHSAARFDQGRPWCEFSEGQLGVFDGNGNGVPDIFEADPMITFFPEGAETVTTNTYTIRFRANATAVKNSNPFQRPDQRVSYALPLSGARLFFGAVQINLDALDGGWNEIEEDTEFIMAVPQAGQVMQITAQVANRAGHQSKRISKLVYFAGVRYQHVIALPKWNRIELAWQTMGETFGAKFDVYRLRNGESKPGTLLMSDVSPVGTGAGGLPMYKVHDFDVKPGERYRYYVEGVFELPFENGRREYRSQSEVVGQTAMVTVTGETVSNVAPNPTRGTVVFSVAVPKTFQNTERGDTRVPTDVDVSVFNVRGQLTRALKRSSEMEPVLTMQWDGTYQDGTQAPSGIYFLRVKAGATETVRKIVLLR